MVRGSGQESGTDSASSKFTYSGSLENWDTAKIKYKSILHKAGLWDVTKLGPLHADESSAEPVLEYVSPDPPPPVARGEYYHALRDNIPRGPFSAEDILNTFDDISSRETITAESIYVFHVEVTGNQWEPWSRHLADKIVAHSIVSNRPSQVQPSPSSSASRETTVRFAESSTPSTATTRAIDFGSPGGRPSATSGRDREMGQQRPRTQEADSAAFHVIISHICDASDVGSMLLRTIDKKFEEEESGHMLYKYLDARASCGVSKDGLVSADELRRKIRDWKFCKNEVITVEKLSLGAEHFQLMWLQQPVARQGMSGDMFDEWMKKLPDEPFCTTFLSTLDATNVVEDGGLHGDYDAVNNRLRALYTQWLKRNSPVKGKGSQEDTALVAGTERGKGKGKGGGGRGGQGGKGRSDRYCYRCWAKNDHLSYECQNPARTCTACGMDCTKSRMSCGGEEDPRKCIIKGYRPDNGIPATFLARLEDWCKQHNVTMSAVAPGARALATHTSPSLVSEQSNVAASTVGPCDSASVVGGGGSAHAIVADGAANTWQFVDGALRPVGSSRTALVSPVALLAFGGRTPFEGEIDCVLDSACTTIGCMPTREGLVNLRAPEIDGMYVGNNQWCPAVVTGDLRCYVVDVHGQVQEFTRVRHVVPELKWHLHGEVAEFEEYGGVTSKGADLVLSLPDGMEVPLLPGEDKMLRLPMFRYRELALEAAPSIRQMHHEARSDAAAHLQRHRSGQALVGQAITADQADKFLKWHAILGCPGNESLRTTLSNSQGHGQVQVPHDAASQFGLCDFCNTYKIIAQPHPPATSHAEYFGGRIEIDDMGPFPTPCIVTGAKYARKFTDEATGYRVIYPIVDYNAAETVAIVKMFMGDHARYLPAGKSFSIVRTDGGSVLRAQSVRDLFDAELVTAEASMPRVPQQMGQNESSGREALRTANAMRGRARAAGQPCGPEYAVLALIYACDVHNHTYTRTWRGNTCPLQLITGKQPNVAMLHAFGASAFTRLTSQERPDKLSSVGLHGQFIGLARGYSGAKMLIRQPSALQQAGIGGIRPAVYIHEYSKLGIDIRVDDAPLYRAGRKLLPSLVDPSAVPSSHPRQAPPPPVETDGPIPNVSPPDEGASDISSSGADHSAPKTKPRKTYQAERRDGSKWQTRQSNNNSISSLVTIASEAEIVSANSNAGGLGAYYSKDETVQSMYLSEIPEHEWLNDDIYALVHIDEIGNIRIAGEEVKRHPYLVRVDMPGVDIQTVALMAKVGDNADGVHVFSGRSDISKEPDAEEWIKARDSEINQLRSIPTWKHVKLKVLKQLGIKPIRTMFVDKVKRSDQNKILEFKSRGVACQFNAMEGRDFEDKFWGVARDSSVSGTLAKGTIPGVKLLQCDLPGFYLRAEPKDATYEHQKSPIIYVSMLPGYKEYDDDGDEAAGVLTASMYGTAIAGRAAGRKLCKDLQNYGFERGVYDRSVYRTTRGEQWLEVACIVDDMIIASYGDELLQDFHDWLQQNWGSGRLLINGTPSKPIKFGPLSWCLGRRVDVDEDLGIVMVSGQQYVDDMAKRYMSEAAANIVAKFKGDIPCDETINKLSTESTRQSPAAAALTRSLIQSLAYCAGKFKHEIMFAVGRLQRFADNPCDDAYKCALQVLKYCMGDKRYGVAWSRTSEEPALQFQMRSDEIYVSVDSSWQVHDKVTRTRSTTGMIFFYKNGPVSVRSSGQKFQAITSTDAESHGIASAMYEGIVIRGHFMWAGVKFTKPTRLENDNSGGVLIARDAASMHRSRATAMRAVFCQECVEQGMYDPVHVSSENMTADVLTKWLPLNMFAKHRAKLTNRRAQSKLLDALTAKAGEV